MIRAREIVYLLLGLMIGIAIAAVRADGVRVEASAGSCSYRWAEDTSWHYGFGPFKTDMDLSPHCGQIGVLWSVDHTFGIRAAYVNLGTVTADNTYPVDELQYIAAKDTKSGISSESGHLQGQQQITGFSFGPVIQAQREGINVSVEAGASILYATWHAMTQSYSDWRYADGWRLSPYIGAAIRWKYLTAGVRVYGNAHASRTDVCDLCFGPTSGHVVQTLVGLSIPL